MDSFQILMEWMIKCQWSSRALFASPKGQLCLQDSGMGHTEAHPSAQQQWLKAGSDPCSEPAAQPHCVPPLLNLSFGPAHLKRFYLLLLSFIRLELLSFSTLSLAFGKHPVLLRAFLSICLSGSYIFMTFNGGMMQRGSIYRALNFPAVE